MPNSVDKVKDPFQATSSDIRNTLPNVFPACTWHSIQSQSQHWSVTDYRRVYEWFHSSHPSTLGSWCMGEKNQRKVKSLPLSFTCASQVPIRSQLYWSIDIILDVRIFQLEPVGWQRQSHEALWHQPLCLKTHQDQVSAKLEWIRRLCLYRLSVKYHTNLTWNRKSCVSSTWCRKCTESIIAEKIMY